MDETMISLRAVESPEFVPLMAVCLKSVIAVIERQYQKYFALEVTETLREEVALARSHNIDSEEIMGMFSAAQAKSPNATLCYPSCKMRATKNKTVEIEPDRCEIILKKAVKFGRLERERKKKKQKEIVAELKNRQKKKEQAKDMTNR